MHLPGIDISGSLDEMVGVSRLAVMNSTTARSQLAQANGCTGHESTRKQWRQEWEAEVGNWERDRQAEPAEGQALSHACPQ